MQLTGMRALEARTARGQARKVWRASTRNADQGEIDSEDVDQATPDLESRATPSARHILHTVWANLGNRQRRLMCLGLLAAIIHALLIPVFSYIISKLLATFFDAQQGTADATRYSLAIIAIAIGDAVACFLMHLLLESCGQAWVDSIRNQAMSRIIDQPMEWFSSEENSSSQLTQTLDKNAEETRNLLGRFAAFMLVAFTLMSVSIVWAMVEDWRLTLVGISMAPVSLFVTRSFQAVSAHMEGVCNNALDQSTAILSEAFTNVKTVRALTLERSFQRKHDISTARGFRIGLRRGVYCGAFFGLSEALILFTDALIFWYGAHLCASGLSTVERILTVLSLLLFSFSSVSASIAIIPQVSSSKDNAARLLELSRLPATSHEHNGDAKKPKSGDIEFHDLSFAYSNKADERVLSNINQVFSHGITTAIVGCSGSGKSTIASLLLRLYASPVTTKHPPIIINDVDINSIKVSALRNLIAVVPQSPVIFPASIHEKIIYGLAPFSPYASAANVKAAAAAAGIADFINTLPDGYATMIGDGGTGISGGQAQRLAIARALVRQPKILILDEATSALDSQSANLIRDTVKGLIDQGRLTVIIVTHTREMMEIADHVVMLEQGRVVESGGFEELLERGGRFATMLRGGVWKDGRPRKEEAAIIPSPDRRVQSDDEWDDVVLSEADEQRVPRFSRMD